MESGIILTAAFLQTHLGNWKDNPFIIATMKLRMIKNDKFQPQKKVGVGGFRVL